MPARPSLLGCSLCLGLAGRLRLSRAGLALGALLTLLFLRLGFVLRADQLQHGHLAAVACARTKPQDASVAPRARREARAQDVEELLDGRVVLDVASNQPTRVNAFPVAFGKPDHSLLNRPELLGLHESSAHAL